ncbi:MAG: hypothetical protein KDK37_06515 [Leptospiraceae bacterium]|nr:hypothetical protein [Leptospiraceae bacterium]MCB1303909.1 hypothetical protein [Leptospiraceae bacterium]
MKTAIVALGLLGSLACFTMGFKWLVDYNHYQGRIEVAQEMSATSAHRSILEPSNLEDQRRASFMLYAVGILALVSSALLHFTGPRTTGVILGVSVLLPFLFTWKTLLATFLFVIAGALALTTRTVKAAPAAQT